MTVDDSNQGSLKAITVTG